MPMMIFNAGQHLQSSGHKRQGYFVVYLLDQQPHHQLLANEEVIKSHALSHLMGRWQGTICSPNRRLAVRFIDITTSGVTRWQRQGAKIKGLKIFISGGKHDACENFVHPGTLAPHWMALLLEQSIISLLSFLKVPAPTRWQQLEAHRCCMSWRFFRRWASGLAGTTHSSLSVIMPVTYRDGWRAEPRKGLSHMSQTMNAARHWR